MLKQSPGCSDSMAFILATWESDQYAVGDAMRITELGGGGRITQNGCKLITLLTFCQLMCTELLPHQRSKIKTIILWKSDCDF